MRLSELQNKDIISVLDGRKLGNIIDAKINQASGELEALIIEPRHFFFNFFSLREEFLVNWHDIEKIGTDVILVRSKF